MQEIEVSSMETASYHGTGHFYFSRTMESASFVTITGQFSNLKS